jgi:hypothetical protein
MTDADDRAASPYDCAQMWAVVFGEPPPVLERPEVMLALIESELLRPRRAVRTMEATATEGLR